MTQLNQNEDARNATAGGSVMSEAVLQQAQTWSRAQRELLSGIETMWSRLLQWQREAVNAASRSLAEMSESRDLGNVLQIQQQWFADAARRTTSNWGELVNDATALTWRVTRVDCAPDQSQSPTPTKRRQNAPNAMQDETTPHREAAK